MHCEFDQKGVDQTKLAKFELQSIFSLDWPSPKLGAKRNLLLVIFKILILVPEKFPSSSEKF
jgi:hypothetical protein